MSVGSTPDGRYYVQWRDGAKVPRKYFGKGELAKNEAERFDAEMKARKRKPDEVQSLSTRKVLELYAAGRIVETVTQKMDEYKVDRLTEALGRIPAEFLENSHLQEYVRVRLSDGVKMATIRRELAVLKAAFAWAETRPLPLITRNGARRFKLRKAGEKDIPFPPSPTEVSQLLAHSEPHLCRVILLTWYTGIRPGASEQFRIRWADVDTERQLIRVVGAKKGGPAIRYVPIPPGLTRYLMDWLNADSEQFADHLQGITLIHYHGRPVASIKRAWKSALTRSGILRRIRPYDLRHAFATNALSEGADLKSTSEIMGHSRPDTTLKEYQHVTMKQHRETVALIPEISDLQPVYKRRQRRSAKPLQ